MRNAVANMVEDLPIALNQVRVGIVAFSNNAGVSVAKKEKEMLVMKGSLGALHLVTFQ